MAERTWPRVGDRVYVSKYLNNFGEVVPEVVGPAEVCSSWGAIGFAFTLHGTRRGGFIRPGDGSEWALIGSKREVEMYEKGLAPTPLAIKIVSALLIGSKRKVDYET